MRTLKQLSSTLPIKVGSTYLYRSGEYDMLVLSYDDDHAHVRITRDHAAAKIGRTGLKDSEHYISLERLKPLYTQV